MQLLLPIFAIAIVAVLGMFGSKKISTLEKEKKEIPTPTITIAETLTPTHMPQSTPRQSAQTNPPTNTPKPQQTQSSGGDFVYPGATIIQDSGGTLTLQSTDSDNNVTNWYKDRIKGKGMNVTSFVVTKTNDNVNNVLAGANSSQEVKVNITKNSGDSIVRIVVSIKNP